MKLYNPFRDLNTFEKALWITSMCVITLSFLISGKEGILSLFASLIGVTALIFVAKGYVFGQVLTVIFAVFYGIISFAFSYYGEVITYLCMSAPVAVMSIISWIKHPYKGTKEVEVAKLSGRKIALVSILAVIVTVLFYFILAYLRNANLIISTLSVTTSFIASFLTYLRSPYYAIGYTLNDIVLIVLWILASVTDISCLPMVFCFVMFLFNDLYGFYSWQKMKKRQQGN